jgi:hypothetical protein
MSVNSRYAISEKKVQRLGKLYSSIDFDVSENITAEQFKTKNDYQVVGNFLIGRQKFPITFKEIERIEETLHEAKNALHRSYQLGLLQ